MVVGLALAVAYHLLAARTQRLALRAGTGAAPAAVIGGYFVRVTIVVVVLFLLGYFTPLNILAVCLAFVVLFTLLNIWSIYNLMSKKKAPPSAGAPGI